MNTQAEVVLEAKAMLGEGAIWHEATQTLYWVDILGKQVHQYNPATGQNKTRDVGEYVGTVVPANSGQLMLALQNGFASLDFDTGKITRHANPESHLPDNRFNDGKCDPAGRFWAGTLSLQETTGAGSLYCLYTDFTFRKMIANVTISNGLVWTGDKKTFYYIDTPTLQVAAYDYDIDTGNITNKRIVITIPEEEGFPDGMTIDTEDMLWIAHFGGWQVCRWNPHTGKKMHSIKIPVSQPTSVAFCGNNLNELYITSARKSLSTEQLQQQPLAGGLFRCSIPGVKGLPAYTFGGKLI